MFSFQSPSLRRPAHLAASLLIAGACAGALAAAPAAAAESSAVRAPSSTNQPAPAQSTPPAGQSTVDHVLRQGDPITISSQERVLDGCSGTQEASWGYYRICTYTIYDMGIPLYTDYEAQYWSVDGQWIPYQVERCDPYDRCFTP